jgi:hypothetical protein
LLPPFALPTPPAFGLPPALALPAPPLSPFVVESSLEQAMPEVTNANESEPQSIRHIPSIKHPPERLV